MTAAGHDTGAPAPPRPAASRPVAPRHRPLAAAELARLHEAALEALASRGVALAGETARTLFAAAGATLEPATGRLLLPVELVRAAVARAPASFVLPGRVPERDVTIGGGPGGLMAATAAAPDVAAAALLADALPEVAVIGLPARRLAELPAAVAASAKPLLVCGALSAAQAAVVIAVATALADRSGAAADRDADADRAATDGVAADRVRTDRSGAPRPPVGVVVHSVEQVDIDPLLACACAGLVCGFYVAPLLGGERPANRSEALIAVHAAALAACAAVQLAAPGAPYIVPALAAAIEDHAPGFGLGPAGVATFTQLAQLAAHAGLPIAAGFPPTRPAADEWLAAADGTFVALAAALAGASLLAVAGHTDGAGVFSPAQLVLDAETWSNVAAVAAGITVDDETLAIETIAAVGIGGNALAQRHTRRHMRDVWKPRLFDRTAFDTWEREGRRSAPQRAATLADELIAGHQVPPLDGEKAATLRRIMQEAGL
jgi:trimethylamine--corrinoid protein Co-methyltransferase